MSTYRAIRDNGVKKPYHRYLMEQHIGRPLTHDEVVHHINGDKHDNRIENLMIMTPKEHANHHNRKYPNHKKCVVCGKTYTPIPCRRKDSKVCSDKCKIQLNSKRVRQYHKDGTFIKEWESIREVSRELKVSHSNIVACLKGRQKTSKGYIWRYANE